MRVKNLLAIIRRFLKTVCVSISSFCYNIEVACRCNGEAANEAVVFSLTIPPHHFIFHSRVLCVVPHISNLPELAVRPTHVCLFEC